MSGFLPVALCCLSCDINIELTRGTQYLSLAENIDVGNSGLPGCWIVHIRDSRYESLRRDALRVLISYRALSRRAAAREGSLVLAEQRETG